MRIIIIIVCISKVIMSSDKKDVTLTAKVATGSSDKKDVILTAKIITHPLLELQDHDVIAVVLDDGRYYVCSITTYLAGYHTYQYDDGTSYQTWRDNHALYLRIAGFFKGSGTTNELGAFKSVSYQEDAHVPDAKEVTWTDLPFYCWQRPEVSIPWDIKFLGKKVSDYKYTEKVKRVELLYSHGKTCYFLPEEISAKLADYKPQL